VSLFTSLYPLVITSTTRFFYFLAVFYGVRLWKLELQRLAEELAIPIRVCHFPPGTSKWNKIENRFFSYISLNWRGQALISHEVIVNLIAATTTCNGLKVQAKIDSDSYPKGVKVCAEEFESNRLIRE